MEGFTGESCEDPIQETTMDPVTDTPTDPAPETTIITTTEKIIIEKIAVAAATAIPWDPVYEDPESPETIGFKNDTANNLLDMLINSNTDPALEFKEVIIISIRSTEGASRKRSLGNIIIDFEVVVEIIEENLPLIF